MRMQGWYMDRNREWMLHLSIKYYEKEKEKEKKGDILQ